MFARPRKRSPFFFFRKMSAFGTDPAGNATSPYRVPSSRMLAVQTPKASSSSYIPNSIEHAVSTPPSSAEEQPSAAGSSSESIVRIRCRCTRSNCLKMYCECFTNNKQCDPTLCECVECRNDPLHAAKQRQARGVILRRNPIAFQAKVHKLHGNRRHTRGCKCQRSRCVKRYCECYREGMQCSSDCACIECCNGKASFSVLPSTTAVRSTDEDPVNASLLAALLDDMPPLPMPT